MLIASQKICTQGITCITEYYNFPGLPKMILVSWKINPDFGCLMETILRLWCVMETIFRNWMPTETILRFWMSKGIYPQILVPRGKISTDFCCLMDIIQDNS